MSGYCIFLILGRGEDGNQTSSGSQTLLPSKVLPGRSWKRGKTSEKDRMEIPFRIKWIALTTAGRAAAIAESEITSHLRHDCVTRILTQLAMCGYVLFVMPQMARVISDSDGSSASLSGSPLSEQKSWLRPGRPRKLYASQPGARFIGSDHSIGQPPVFFAWGKYVLKSVLLKTCQVLFMIFKKP